MKVNEMIATATFWDKIADKYSERPVPDEAAYATTLDRTRHYLCKTDEVLELGCGTGTTAIKLAPFVADMTATDISQRMVEIGREKARSAGANNVILRRATIEELHEEQHKFDAVLAFNLLHLLQDPADEIRRIRDMVKPGGVFISKTVCLGPSAFWMKPMLGLLQLIGKAPHVQFLNVRALEEEIENAGFEIIEVGNYPMPRNRFVVARKL